jgi:hypothetical protein
LNNGTKEIRFDLRTELLKRGVLNWGDVAVASVVHQDVELAEGADRCLDGLVCLCLVGDIQYERENKIAILVFQLRQIFYLASSRCYLAACCKCSLSERSS